MNHFLFFISFRARKFLINILLKFIIGNLSDVSPYLQPKFNFLEAHPTLSGELLHKICHGDIIVKPNIKKILAKGVEFDDGSFVEIDEIILATGYDFEIPFVDKTVLNVIY